MRVFETLGQALANAGTARPDGRLLHAYNVPDELYSRMHAALSRVPCSQMRAADTAGLYVIWAAERIRRHYDGSGLSWDFINAPLPHLFDGQRVEAFIRRGLDYWVRPLRYGRSGNRLFMYTLMAEGGIPLSVLEGASQHAQVLRQMIEEIGNRGGIDILGFEAASQLARTRMRYLPKILHNSDSIALFVDLAQSIFELRQAIPQGMPAAQIETWLNSERPDWQRELPMRLTPQVIDNIIRPSLAVARQEVRASAHPAHREVHSDLDGRLHPVVILAPKAALPLASLPATEATVLRLLPRFATPRPLAYRALRATDGLVWELERLGGSGPEVVPLALFETLEFDVMVDSQTLATWQALPSLPQLTETVTLWAGQGAEGQPPRLRVLTGGRSRAGTIWATVPTGAEISTEGALTVAGRHEVVGADLVELHGQGALRHGAHRLRITTGAEFDCEAASLFFFGKTLPTWRLSNGESIYLGPPQVYGQRGETPMVPVPLTQLRRGQRPGSIYGAEFYEWALEGEQIALARQVGLPADLNIDLQERPDGTLALSASGLPPDLLVDLRAGSETVSVRSTAGPIALILPPRAPATAFVTLVLTELSTGRSLELATVWPSTQPQLLCNGAILPVRNQVMAFDELRMLTAIAPGNRTRMSIALSNGRSFEIPISGTVPLIRHETLLRKVLLQGSADNSISISMHNSAGQTGRIVLRRYHAAMSLSGDLLKLGMPVDMPRGGLSETQQLPGQAALHLLQIDTGEVMRLSVDVSDHPIDLRTASAVDSGFWLVQGQFDGHQQRPVAWLASVPDPMAVAAPSRRDARIMAYRNDFNCRAAEGGSDSHWRQLLRQLLAAQAGGDPAMLDQFHALADAPQALARMLLSLPESDLPQLFGLDSYWNVFWAGFPVSPLVDITRQIYESTMNMLLMGGLVPSAAQQMSSTILVERLALLRILRPEIGGQIAIVLIESGLIAHVVTDSRFEGLFIAQPKKALNEAIQVIARSDPNLPRGIRNLPPVMLDAPCNTFQATVEIMICAVLSTAEQALGLRKKLDPEALLDAMLIEATSPELFIRALQPAMLIAYSKRQSLK